MLRGRLLQQHLHSQNCVCPSFEARCSPVCTFTSAQATGAQPGWRTVSPCRMALSASLSQAASPAAQSGLFRLHALEPCLSLCAPSQAALAGLAAGAQPQQLKPSPNCALACCPGCCCSEHGSSLRQAPEHAFPCVHHRMLPWLSLQCARSLSHAPEHSFPDVHPHGLRPSLSLAAADPWRRGDRVQSEGPRERGRPGGV